MSELSCYDFKSFKFGRYSHYSRSDGMCIMEAVAYIAGEEHSFCPNCADPTITNIAIILNDNIIDDDERNQLLSPFLWRIVGTFDKEYLKQREEIFKKFLLEIKSLDLIHNSLSYKISNDDCYIYLELPFDSILEDVNYCSKADFDNLIKGRLLAMLDELISMTEIKEASPKLVKEKIYSAN